MNGGVNIEVPAQNAPFLTIKRILYPLLAHPRVAHAIKYTVYIGLIFNLGRFAWDDFLAMEAALPADASLDDYLTQFATTIDMLGWVGLVFLLELETEFFSRTTRKSKIHDSMMTSGNPAINA